MGGNTGNRAAGPGVLPVAAMEPPGNGRKHLRAAAEAPDPHGAAMEPPGNGRKHTALPWDSPAGATTPQWSRRVMGGNTREAREHRPPRASRPQWSRPVMGGNTRSAEVSPVAKGSGPQWSRPVMGGNTRRGGRDQPASTGRNGAAR